MLPSASSGGAIQTSEISVFLDSADPHEISALVAQLLLIIPVSKREVASLIGISRQQLYRWEGGEAVPTLEELERLAAIASKEINITLNAKGPPLRERVARNTEAIRFLTELLERLHPNNPEITQVLKDIRERTNYQDT